MKKIICIFWVLGLVIMSCEDVVEIEVPNAEPRLVVDASFLLFLNEDPLYIEGGVRLTLSAPFFDKEVPTVSDATVFITNKADGSIINFVESTQPGFYLPEEVDFDSETSSSYQLTVIYKEETYVADATVVPVVPLDSVKQGDSSLISDEIEVKIEFTDDGNRNDFYLIDLDFNLFLTTEDEFYQGEKFTFSYFYENVIAGRELTIKLIGVDEDYYRYSALLIEQSEQDSNPFQVPPASLRGNIINKTNPDHYALGYFNVSEASRLTIKIREE